MLPLILQPTKRTSHSNTLIDNIFPNVIGPDIYRVISLPSFLIICLTLRKKCAYSELFWSAFFPYFPAFGLNTGKCGKNAAQNNFEYGHFLRSVNLQYFPIYLAIPKGINLILMKEASYKFIRKISF